MKISLITRSALQTVLSLGVLLSIAAAADVPVRRLNLDDGLHLLYNLDLADVHRFFLSCHQCEQLGWAAAGGESAMLRRVRGHRIQQVHCRYYGRSSALVGAAAWSFGR